MARIHRITFLSLLLCILLLGGCVSPSQPDVQPPRQNTTTPDAPPSAPEDIPAEPTPLTVEELAAVESWFNNFENNGLLRFPLDDPQAAEALAPYLGLLFYDVGETDITDREREALAAEDFFMETDVFRLRRQSVEQFLSDKLGLGGLTSELEQAMPGTYLPGEDAWYICHGDVMFYSYSFDEGQRSADGETVTILYTNDFLSVTDGNGDFEYISASMELTLRAAGDGWQLLSHRIRQ